MINHSLKVMKSLFTNREALYVKLPGSHFASPPFFHQPAEIQKLLTFAEGKQGEMLVKLPHKY